MTKVTELPASGALYDALASSHRKSGVTGTSQRGKWTGSDMRARHGCTSKRDENLFQLRSNAPGSSAW